MGDKSGIRGRGTKCGDRNKSTHFTVQCKGRLGEREGPLCGENETREDATAFKANCNFKLKRSLGKTVKNFT